MGKREANGVNCVTHVYKRRKLFTHFDFTFNLMGFEEAESIKPFADKQKRLSSPKSI